MPKKTSTKRTTNKGKSQLRDLPAKKGSKVKGGGGLRRTSGMPAPSISGAWIS